MRISKANGLLAALTLVSAVSAATIPSASAYDPPYAWFGEMVLLTATTGCGNRVKAGDAPVIVFRPKLQAAERNSALSYLFGHSSGIVTKQATTLYMTGSGASDNLFVSGRATIDSLVGSYNLRVTPSTVVPSTQFLTFTGSLANFAGRSGCTVTVRGAAAQRLQD